MDKPGQVVQGFDGVALGKHLLRTIRAGALATLDGQGFPFATLVTVATDIDGSPILLTSRLSSHTANLEREPQVSLLLAQTGKGDPLAHPRLTVIGRAERTDLPRIRARFLARHPKAELYVDFPDFSFWRLEILAGHLNGGFAKAATLSGADLRTDISRAETLIEAEASAVAHMNEDHREALQLYATHFAGAAPGAWRTTGLDPDGIDLMLGDQTARVAFPEPVVNPEKLRLALKNLAQQARDDLA
jgi:putative heme iron utilization protein